MERIAQKKVESLIIHITKEFENLKNILSSKSLTLSFSCENFYWNGKPISKAAHPMICFSEYDPETIDSKTITYGKYGIGFSKIWAREKNIGPVLYVSESSVAAKGMKDLLIARKKTKEDKLPRKLRLAIMEVKCFMKNEKGLNSHNGKPNFDFKAGNEWRYIPKKSEINNYLISQNQRTYIENKDKHNEKLKKFPLEFELSDIESIYVSNKAELDIIKDKFNISETRIIVAKWQTT